MRAKRYAIIMNKIIKNEEGPSDVLLFVYLTVRCVRIKLKNYLDFKIDG